MHTGKGIGVGTLYDWNPIKKSFVTVHLSDSIKKSWGAMSFLLCFQATLWYCGEYERLFICWRH